MQARRTKKSDSAQALFGPLFSTANAGLKGMKKALYNNDTERFFDTWNARFRTP